MVRVEEVHGGTKGTDYIFVIKGKEILHISQIGGAKCIFKENRKRKRSVVWEVPDKEVENCEALWVSYSNSGHLGLYLLKLPSASELSAIRELDYSKLIKYRIIEDTKKVISHVKSLDLKFKKFSREHNMCTAYFKYVPKLVEDFWSSMKKLGIYSVYMGGGGHRLDEVLQDPELGYIISMLLPTEQGRVLSLYKKLSGMFELWTLSKVAETLGQLGKIINSKDWISLESTRNNKVLEFDINGNKYAIFYQPTIAPHVISGLLPKDELKKLKKRLGVKELHLIPDIVVAENVDEYLNWGELYKIRDKVKLIVEAKLSLGGTTKYDTISVAESQLEAYTKLLNTNALVVILEPNNHAKFRLKKDVGVEVVDDAINNADKIEEVVKELV